MHFLHVNGDIWIKKIGEKDAYKGYTVQWLNMWPKGQNQLPNDPTGPTLNLLTTAVFQ